MSQTGKTALLTFGLLCLSILLSYVDFIPESWLYEAQPVYTTVAYGITAVSAVVYLILIWRNLIRKEVKKFYHYILVIIQTLVTLAVIPSFFLFSALALTQHGFMGPEYDGMTTVNNTEFYTYRTTDFPDPCNNRNPDRNYGILYKRLGHTPILWKIDTIPFIIGKIEYEDGYLIVHNSHMCKSAEEGPVKIPY